MSSRRALPLLEALLRAAPCSISLASRPSRHLAAPQRLSRLRKQYAPLHVRSYSQSQSAASKIWFFEDIQKLSREPRDGVVIVDTREPSELQSSGRIPGALNIPITSAPDSFHIGASDFEDRFGFARPPKDAELVLYCKAGVRSRAAAGLARDAGWTKVGEYPGSFMDWSAKGGESEGKT